MKFNILFRVLKLISIIVKPLSCIIYAEILSHIISYVFTGFCLLYVVFCFSLCLKLEGQLSNHYLRVGFLQKWYNEDRETVYMVLKFSFFSKSEELVLMWKADASLVGASSCREETPAGQTIDNPYLGTYIW